MKTEKKVSYGIGHMITVIAVTAIVTTFSYSKFVEEPKLEETGEIIGIMIDQIEENDEQIKVLLKHVGILENKLQKEIEREVTYTIQEETSTSNDEGESLTEKAKQVWDNIVHKVKN